MKKRNEVSSHLNGYDPFLQTLERQIGCDTHLSRILVDVRLNGFVIDLIRC